MAISLTFTAKEGVDPTCGLSTLQGIDLMVSLDGNSSKALTHEMGLIVKKILGSSYSRALEQERCRSVVDQISCLGINPRYAKHMLDRALGVRDLSGIDKDSLYKVEVEQKSLAIFLQTLKGHNLLTSEEEQRYKVEFAGSFLPMSPEALLLNMKNAIVQGD